MRTDYRLALMWALGAPVVAVGGAVLGAISPILVIAALVTALGAFGYVIFKPDATSSVNRGMELPAVSRQASSDPIAEGIVDVVSSETAASIADNKVNIAVDMAQIALEYELQRLVRQTKISQIDDDTAREGSRDASAASRSPLASDSGRLQMSDKRRHLMIFCSGCIALVVFIGFLSSRDNSTSSPDSIPARGGEQSTPGIAAPRTSASVVVKMEYDLVLRAACDDDNFEVCGVPEVIDNVDDVTFRIERDLVRLQLGPQEVECPTDDYRLLVDRFTGSSQGACRAYIRGDEVQVYLRVVRDTLIYQFNLKPSECWTFRRSHTALGRSQATFHGYCEKG
ncbi:hypothetical protein [Bradyrhizobium sp. UNPF46]|uniref:hypothetical protein n=1 Tax=Bradyrhizobium sp. UNPF46 TaxID=1141168 RepID=UPI00115010A6|nr:hypothetical protein [Bradyrhizobium sp. UNPF46]